MILLREILGGLDVIFSINVDFYYYTIENEMKKKLWLQ